MRQRKPPAEVIAAARAAFRMRLPGTTIADVVSDALGDQTRSPDPARHLVFGTQAMRIMVTARRVGPVLELSIRTRPRARGTVRLVRDGPPVSLARFATRLRTRPGWTSLVVESDRADAPIQTAWLAL